MVQESNWERAGCAAGSKVLDIGAEGIVVGSRCYSESSQRHQFQSLPIESKRVTELKECKTYVSIGMVKFGAVQLMGVDPPVPRVSTAEVSNTRQRDHITIECSAYAPRKSNFSRPATKYSCGNGILAASNQASA